MVFARIADCLSARRTECSYSAGEGKPAASVSSVYKPLTPSTTASQCPTDPSPNTQHDAAKELPLNNRGCQALTVSHAIISI